MVETNDPSVRRPLDPRAIDAASAFLKDTVIAMGLDADVNVREEGGDTVLELSGPDAKHLVGKKGATIDALQLLSNRVATKTVGGDRASLTAHSTHNDSHTLQNTHTTHNTTQQNRRRPQLPQPGARRGQADGEGDHHRRAARAQARVPGRRVAARRV